MAKLNEQQILQYLKQRRQELSSELNKIESALNALTGDIAKPTKTGKRKYTRRASVVTAVKQKPSRRGRKKSVESTIQPASSQKVTANDKKPVKNAESKETSAGGWDQKIIDVLSSKGAATKEEVVSQIADQVPEAHGAKLGRAISLRLTVMANSGRISKRDEDGAALYTLQ